MASKLCPFCMRMSEGETCPHCGKNINYIGSQAHLPAGYVVSGKHPYVLGAALGQGGFGITYIALDMVTNERVAIKEYFPTYCSGRTHDHTVSAYPNQEEVYVKGRDRFLDEARTLKSLSDLKNIVNVLDFFEANNTAYLVMEFLDGSALKDYALQNGRFPARKFLEQITPLMEDLERMHQRGVVHRDIAPDNIILLPDGQMKLIDFGAARSYVGDKSMTVVVKKGFAPVEQYLSKGTTASTDVYALAATIYYCITGTVPMDSAERQYENVSLPSPSSLGADLLPNQEQALEQAMKIQQRERTQSVQEFLENLKPRKPDPVKKKGTGRIVAAILAVIAVVGILLVNRSPKEEPQKLEASMETTTVYTEPVVEGPAWKRNVLMAGSAVKGQPVFNTDIPRHRVTEVFFLDTVSSAPEKVYDVSADQNGSVLAWTEENGSEGTLSLYIAGEGGVNGAKACYALFYYYTKLEAVHFDGNFYTEDADSMYGMFKNCVKLKSLDLGSFDTTNVTDMSSMFAGCSTLSSLDLGSFDTSNVTDMSDMFSFCENLTSLDLGSFDTTNVTDMSSIFRDCKNLTSLDFSAFDTSNVTDMSFMFTSCGNLTSLDLSNFNTSNVKSMESMFASCVKLVSLDLRAFNTSNVTDMHYMFSHCENLASLDVRSFDTSNVTDMSYMFNGCKKLITVDVSKFNFSKIDEHHIRNFMDPEKTINGNRWSTWFRKKKN